MVKKAVAVQVKVRIPKDLQRKIQREADRRGQTINAEILRRLDISFEFESTLSNVDKTLSTAQEVMKNMRAALDEVPADDFLVSFVSEKYGIPKEEVAAAIKARRGKDLPIRRTRESQYNVMLEKIDPMLRKPNRSKDEADD